MHKYDVPSCYGAQILECAFDPAQARHVAQLRIRAGAGHSMVMTCQAELAEHAPQAQVQQALIQDAARQLSRLPEHRRGPAPRVEPAPDQD